MVPKIRVPKKSKLRASDVAWYQTPWRIAGRAIGSALAIVVFAALIALLVVPRLLGGDSLTVLSGSMEPTFSPGDVVVVKGIDDGEVCTDISVGTIITYFPEANDPTLITHRVVGKTIGTFEDGTSCRLITQGDANSSVDEPVSPAQVRGVFMYGVPGLGWARQWVSQNPALLGGIAVAVLIGWGLWSSTRKPQTTVVSVPRASSPSAAAGPFVPPEPREQELRERELELRERELALRERELAYAIAGRADAPPVSFDLSPVPQSSPRIEA